MSRLEIICSTNNRIKLPSPSQVIDSSMTDLEFSTGVQMRWIIFLIKKATNENVFKRKVWPRKDHINVYITTEKVLLPVVYIPQLRYFRISQTMNTILQIIAKWVAKEYLKNPNQFWTKSRDTHLNARLIECQVLRHPKKAGPIWRNFNKWAIFIDIYISY